LVNTPFNQGTVPHSSKEPFNFIKGGKMYLDQTPDHVNGDIHAIDPLLATVDDAPAPSIPERSPRHAAALRLAAEGIPVVPCLVGGKKPAIENGFHRRSADPAVINAWWAEADYNLGVVPHDMGLVAFDLDLYKGVSKPIRKMLVPTRTHATPSGGEHRLYLSFEAFSNKTFAENVDIRSANGYILWPPSIVNGVEYRVIDDREPEMLPENARAGLGQAQDKADICQVPDDGVDKMLPEAREWCARYADNQSGDRFVAAAALVRNFGLTNATATELCEEFGIRMHSDQAEGGTSWEQTLDNARRHGEAELGTGVAWQPPPAGPIRFAEFLARQQERDRLARDYMRDPSAIPADKIVGYAPGDDMVFDEFLEVLVPTSVPILAGSEKGKAILDKLLADLGGVAGAKRRRFTIRPPEEDEIAPPIEFFDAKKLLPKHPSVGFAYGKQGAHKTGLFVKLGLDAVEKGAKVLYIAAEGAYGFKTASLPKARDARGMARMTLSPHWRTVSDTFSLMRPEDHEALDEALGDFRPGMIFVDVLTRVAAGLDINTPDGAQRIINAAYALAERFGCPVVFAAHPGKDMERGLMGSYLFEALADFVWKVSHKDGKVYVKVEKLKDGPADRVEVFAVDMSNGAPVVVDAPAEVQPKVAEQDTLADLVKKFLDGDKRRFDTAQLADEIAPLQSKAGFAIKDIKQALRRRANKGQFNGYVVVVTEGAGDHKPGDYEWHRQRC
jgi:hypothetical protein